MYGIVLLFGFFIMANSLYALELDSIDLKKKVTELILQLTSQEKASLCSGRDDWSTQPIERLEIPFRII